MGQVISSRRDQDFSEDETPVMGSGHCPIYDATCVGDWSKVVELCKPGIVNEKLDRDLKNKVVVCDARCEDTRLDHSGELNDREGVHDDHDIHETDFRFHPSIRSAHDEATCSNFNPPLFIDAKGNTPLHIACSHHRNPPSPAILALLSLHPHAAWICTHNGWLPLHLACYIGRMDVEVLNELMEGMEIKRRLYLENGGRWNEGVQITEFGKNEKNDTQTISAELHLHPCSSLLTEHQIIQLDSSDPFFPQDNRGRTPLHLACSSPRDPQRRPDLIRLLLLRSNEPRKLVLTRDWIHEKRQGRTALDIIMDDFKEEIEEALLPGFSVVDAIHAWNRGRFEEEMVDNTANTHFEALYECWAIMSLLVLAAGSAGSVDQVREVLGGHHSPRSVDRCTTSITTNEPSGQVDCVDGGHHSANSTKQFHHNILSKPCQEVIKDFHAIYSASQSLGADFSHPHFLSLAKKLVKGEIDKRSIGSVSELKNRWETSSLKSLSHKGS